MNEQQAWNRFSRTGKIEDYLIYTQIKSQTEALGALSIRGETGAGQNAGVDHSGTNHWRKR